MLERFLYKWGRFAASRSRTVMVAVALVGVAATPFSLKAIRNLDSNLFNQASASLKRFSLLREISETFGGEMLATVLTIPDAHSPQDVKELKAFALLMTTELEKVGTLDEDIADLSEKIKNDLKKFKPGEEVLNDPFADKESQERARAPVPWLRNVECRTGQGIEGAMKTLARQHPYLLLEPDDVEKLKGLFEPDALKESMARIRKSALELPAHSPEKTRLYEDPLGVLELGKTAYQARLKKRSAPLSLDADGFFLSPDGTTMVILARTVLPGSRVDFDRILMVAAQRAENRAIQKFRALNPSPALTASMKSEQFCQLAKGETPGKLSVGYTGMSAIYVENELTLKWDLAINTGTSLLGILLLFLIVYRSMTLTWQVTLATVYTIWLTIAFAGIWKGSLSLLGGAFTAIPVGLGTDYAIMVFNTYQRLRATEDIDAPEAMARTLASCGPSILTAALISSIAFFGVGFTHLTGLAEFGVLGGISTVLGCAVMLFALPAWMAGDVQSGARANESTSEGLSFGMPTLGRWLESRSARVFSLTLGVIVLVVGVGVIKYGPDPGPEMVAGVRFDAELGNLRSLNTRAIPLRMRITERFKIALGDINAVISAPNEESAFKSLSEIQALVKPYVDRGEISYNGCVTDVLPPPERQRASIAALKTLDVDESIKKFQSAAQEAFGIKGAAFFNPFLRRMRDIKFLLADPKTVTLSSLMNGPLANVLATSAHVEAGAELPVRMRVSWLPRDPNMSSAWYTTFAETLEKSPSSGGTVRCTAAKMVGFELKHVTLNDCGWITLVVSICVALSLAAALRSVRKCLLALVPLLFAFVAMLAGVPISQCLGWDYTLNFVNLIMFPLLLGSAVDYGVYMVFGFSIDPRPKIGALMSVTGRSVLYCMATTLIGFGSFVTSSYTGLLSMGVASLWGYAGATFGALLVMPAIMGCLPEKSEAPH